MTLMIGRPFNWSAMLVPKYLDDLLDSAPVMIDALAPNSRLAFWNRECERVSGYPRQMALSDRNLARRRFPDLDDFIENARQTLRDGTDTRDRACPAGADSRQ